jgi:hypothetical protein
MHPSLEPQVQKELKKLLDAKIIFQVKHSTWVANLVLVRKKTGEIHLCVELSNLNKDFKKGQLYGPPMEQIFQACIKI